MVVCKFFLQGYCRFGDNCKFEHQINDTPESTKNQHASILWQSQLNSPHYQNSSVFQKQNTPVFNNLQDTNPGNSTAVDVDTLIKSVVNDMTAVEKGGQWLLSCYGPFKEKPVFPGFEDYSSEEIRSGFYDAIKNGSIEQYKQHVNNLLQQAIIRIKSLQKPTPEIVEVLKSIYNTPVLTSNSASTYGNSSTMLSQNTFGQQNSSIFANQNLFSKPTAGHGSMFGGTQTVNNQPQAGNQHIFAQANANLASPKNSSIFGNQSNSAASTAANVFSNQPLFNQSSSQPNVSASQNSGIFQQTNIATNSMFGNQNSTQFPQVTQPLVASTPQSSVFAVAQNPTSNSFTQQSSIFGSNFATSTPQIQAQQSSIFQNQAANTFNNPEMFLSKRTESGQNMNIFGVHLNAPPIDETIYSKLEELTDDEIKWFQSDDLDPMKIPEKPPTFEVCFKT